MEIMSLQCYMLCVTTEVGLWVGVVAQHDSGVCMWLCLS